MEILVSIQILKQCLYFPNYCTFGYTVVTHCLYYDECCFFYFKFLHGCIMKSCCNMSKPFSALPEMSVDCIHLSLSMCIAVVDLHLLNKPYIPVKILINPGYMIWYFLEFALPKHCSLIYVWLSREAALHICYTLIRFCHIGWCWLYWINLAV